MKVLKTYHLKSENIKNGFPLQTNTLDLIIAAEVLEHMADPWDCTDKLESYLSDTGEMVITVPFGPWGGDRL